MKKVALFLSVLTLSLSTAFSQPAKSPRGCLNNMFSELGLTAEQKEKLKTLHSEMGEARKKNFEAVRTIREKTKEELLKGEPSKSALDTYAGELGNLHKEITIARHDHLLKIKQILTAEQFSKIVNKECNKERAKEFHKGCSKECSKECKAAHGKTDKCPKSKSAHCKMNKEM